MLTQIEFSRGCGAERRFSNRPKVLFEVKPNIIISYFSMNTRSLIAIIFIGIFVLVFNPRLLATTPAVAGGGNHALALKSDGTVWAWGDNTYGELGDGTTTPSNQPVEVISPGGVALSGIIAVAAGTTHSLALKNDKTVWAWGDNTWGQLGNAAMGDPTADPTPYTAQQQNPVQVHNLTDVVAIAAGRSFSVAVKSDGTVWTWGYNGDGELGNGQIGFDPPDGYAGQQDVPVQVMVQGPSGLVSLTGAVSVSVGAMGSHVLVLMDDGSVLTWGLNAYGQLGNGYTNLSSIAVKAVDTNGVALSGILSVAAGDQHSLAIKSDHTVLAWGFNFYNGLGNGTTTNSNHAVPVLTSAGVALTGINAIAAGEGHSLAVDSNGKAWAFGFGSDGQLGSGSNSNLSYAAQLSGISNLVSVAAGVYTSFATDSAGNVWSWGSNNQGKLGFGLPVNVNSPVQVLKNLNEVSLPPMIAVAGGADHSLAIDSTGNVWGWGFNFIGELGQAGEFSRGLYSSTLPIQVSGLTGITQIIGGQESTFALDNQGNVWGLGYYNQNSQGSLVSSSQPVQIAISNQTGVSPSQYGISAIAAGAWHRLAIRKSDGTVWAWGDNTQGELGNGTTTSTGQIVQAGSLSSIVAISAGNYDSLALDSSGNVWAWGYNYYGQLGNGENIIFHISQPALVSASSGVTFTGASAIASGTFHNLALKNGIVWAWGYNAQGELGNGNTANSSYPVQVTGFTGTSPVVAIGAGAYYSWALRQDGTIWVWGLIPNGTGSITLTSATQVSGFDGATILSAGYYHLLVLKADGAIASLYNNVNGELGVGGIDIESLVPLTIPGLNLTQSSPTVTITSPSNNSTINLGQTGSFQVNTSSGGGSITKVEYFNEQTKIGESDAAPWGTNWTPPTWGDFHITTIATTSQGLVSALSAPVTIHVPFVASILSVGTGTYATPQTVTISGPTGAVIYYTIDGTTPTNASILYTGPININSSETIKAQTYVGGQAYGGMGSASYTLNPTSYPPPSSAPSAPSDLAAFTSGGGEVTLNWTNNATNADVILIQQENSGGLWSTVATVDPSQSSDIINNLSFGMNLTFRIVVANNIGSNSSGSASVIPTYAPRYAVVDLGLNNGPGRITNSGYVQFNQRIGSPYSQLCYRWYNGVTSTLAPWISQAEQEGDFGATDITEDGTVVGFECDTPPANHWGFATWGPTSTTPTLASFPPFGNGYESPILTDPVHDHWYKAAFDNSNAGSDGYENSTRLGNWARYDGPPTTFSGEKIFAIDTNNLGHAILQDNNQVTGATSYSIQGHPLSFFPLGMNNVDMVVGVPGGPTGSGGILWDGTTTRTLTAAYPVSINAATANIGGTVMPAYQILSSNITTDFNVTLTEMDPATGTFQPTVLLNNYLPLLPGLTVPGWNMLTVGNRAINDTGTIAGTAQPADSNGHLLYNYGGYPVSHGVLLIPAELAVDADRNGTIVMSNGNPAGHDANGNLIDVTTPNRPYRFWINNNESIPGSPIDSFPFDPGPNTVPPSVPDYQSNTLVSQRDLEDWSRLWIYTGLPDAINSGKIKVGLKWKKILSGTPGIKIMTASDADGGMEYLKDATGAAAGVQSGPDANNPNDNGTYRKLIADVNSGSTNIVPTSGVTDFVFPTWVWHGVSASNMQSYFLFEGSSEGSGELEIVLLQEDGTTLIGEGGGTWLDLLDIKEMYKRAIASNAGVGNPSAPEQPYITNTGFFNDALLTTTEQNTGSSDPLKFNPPVDETKQCLIFVHGWWTGYNQFIDYSETMYKRLWWEGYKGRFISYNWPALSGPQTYNSSEWVGWVYGKPFMDYVNNLKANFNTLTIASHSQGAVVVGSAIEQGLTFNKYILLEAAIPTGCYSNNTTYNSYQPFLDAEAIQPTPDLTVDYGYRGYITAAIGNVGQYYCFYNPLDYALATGTINWGIAGFTIATTSANWEGNQISFKPDGNPGQSYAGLYEMRSGIPTFTAGSPATHRPITDNRESISFVARSRSKAVGADVYSTSVFTAATGLNHSYGFGSELSDHSGQFNREMYQVDALYSRLKLIIAPPGP